MTRYDQKMRLFAACLSAVAGYVDAIGFMESRGFFVSFMSGNSTRVGVGVVQGSSHGLVAAGLIVCFLLGVVGGSVAGHLAGRMRRAMVLALVTGLLVGAASFNARGIQAPAVALMAVAMGAENAVFTEDGEVRIGLTYMTGTLVKLGQGLSLALFGGPPLGWLPYFLLWFGLLLGAFAGAGAYHVFGLAALWGAATLTLMLSAIAAQMARGPGGG